MAGNRPFWETKPLSEMSTGEWEALCDGCGKCCLHKLEDEETGEVQYTAVACRLLDLKTVRCRNYKNRNRWVADCLRLTPEKVRVFKWLPETCAYKRLAEGKPLPGWHPLITGDPESVHRAGASIKGKAIPESQAGELSDHVLKKTKFRVGKPFP